MFIRKYYNTPVLPLFYLLYVVYYHSLINSTILSFAKYRLTPSFNFVEEFPGLLIAAATVDRLGRKLSMSAMFFSCCIFLLPLAFHQPEGLTTILLFGARVCITGTFTVAYIYAPEVTHSCQIFNVNFHFKRI